MHNRIARNASWIIVCKGIQAVLGLIIMMLTARLFGPQNYGVISYASSLTLFVTPLAQLGLTSTLVGELLSSPQDEGEILGSAMVSSMLSSTLCIIGIIVFARVTLPEDPLAIWVCALYSLSLLAQSAELLQYWFQARLLSKYMAVFTLIAYAVMSVYQLLVLMLGRNMLLYALSKGIEYTLIALGLLIAYRHLKGRRLRVSRKRCLTLLRHSRFYMLSSMMVTLLGQTDRIMLMSMLGETQVGFYSAAVVCANLTDFVFVAIIDSFRPAILAARHRDPPSYERQLARLYAIVFYLALIQSVVITLLAKPIVTIMYGSAYSPAVGVLQALVWYTAFSCIGSARMIWIYAEGQQRLLCLVNLLGALMNISLNLLLIPRCGAMGAALASLLTQAFTNVGLGWVFPSLRKNNELLLRGIKLQDIGKLV
ncbi:MAG: flippase [Aristaeellaceae bacterium]